MKSEELINLLSVATYGSDWLEIRTKKVDKCENEPEFSCREERWAYRLLHDKPIYCLDYFADDDEVTVHKIYLKDIKKGLQKARNGAAPQDYWNFKNERDDYYTGSNLMQVILYGEVVYG